MRAAIARLARHRASRAWWTGSLRTLVRRGGRESTAPIAALDMRGPGDAIVAKTSATPILGRRRAAPRRVAARRGGPRCEDNVAQRRSAGAAPRPTARVAATVDAVLTRRRQGRPCAEVEGGASRRSRRPEQGRRALLRHARKAEGGARDSFLTSTHLAHDVRVGEKMAPTAAGPRALWRRRSPRGARGRVHAARRGRATRPGRRRRARVPGAPPPRGRRRRLLRGFGTGFLRAKTMPLSYRLLQRRRVRHKVIHEAPGGPFGLSDWQGRSKFIIIASRGHKLAGRGGDAAFWRAREPHCAIVSGVITCYVAEIP